MNCTFLGTITVVGLVQKLKNVLLTMIPSIDQLDGACKEYDIFYSKEKDYHVVMSWSDDDSNEFARFKALDLN